MLKEFPDIDPLNPQASGRLLASITSDERPEENYHFLAVGMHHIIIASCEFKSFRENEPPEWFVNQLVLPRRGIPWYVDTIENKFFKKPEEGGLSADEFKWTETVDGEKLQVARSFGTVGYTLSTLSRRDEDGFALEFTFTDEFLFEHGMFDAFKRVADLVRQGEL